MVDVLGLVVPALTVLEVVLDCAVGSVVVGWLVVDNVVVVWTVLVELLEVVVGTLALVLVELVDTVVGT